jgi:hypothetical protein
VSKAYTAEDIITDGEVSPSQAGAFAEEFVYLFYGRPAYRATTDKVVKSESACPYCFLFSSSLLREAKAVYPFDTGAFSSRLFKHVMIEEMAVEDFSLDRDISRLNRIISASFRSPESYYDGDTSQVPDPGDGAEAWEMAGRAYLHLLKSPGRNEPDDRVGSIEALFEKPVSLATHLKALVVPHTHWLEGREAPWLCDLRQSGVHILTYNFVPGRPPEYYQTMVDAAVRRFYIEAGLLSEQ